MTDLPPSTSRSSRASSCSTSARCRPVVGYRIAVTPDRLLGRVEAVRSSIALSITPLGPLVAGFLLEKISARETIAFFCLFNVVLLTWGVFSPAIRHAPSLNDLATAEG